jgi:hypothetical protein
MNAFIYSSNVAKKFLLARRGSVMEKCEIEADERGWKWLL